MTANAIRICSPEPLRSTVAEDGVAQSLPAIRVLSVDDHPALSAGIAAVVNRQTDMKIIGAASSGREGIRKFCELQPDVTLMDLRLPDLSGIDALISIRSKFPKARILILTTFDRGADILRSLQAGAAGYLLKSGPRHELLAAIRNVHRGTKCLPGEVAARLAEQLNHEPLSRREIEVLRHLAGGNSNRDIARILFVSEETVKVHVRHIMEKLGANDRTHAVAIGVRHGIIQI